jgi:predicted O-methyltransferase YrrM
MSALPFVTLAHVDEVLRSPELLGAYARTFAGDHDGTTLLVYAPDAEAAETAASLAGPLEAAGLDDAGSPEVILLAVPAADGDPVVVDSVGAVMSSLAPRPGLEGVVHVAAPAAPFLRSLAGRRSPAPLPVPAPPPVEPASDATLIQAPDSEAKRAHLLGLFQRRGHSVFIESGTYLGDTVAYFRPHARRIVSVEVEPALYAAAQRRFSGETAIEIVEGDSLTLLPAIVAGCQSPPLVWLDGHFSGGVTGQGAEVEPAPAILEALRVAAGTTIVVDDLRMFGRDPEPWPSLDRLVAAARRAFPLARIYCGLDSLVIEA